MRDIAHQHKIRVAHFVERALTRNCRERIAVNNLRCVARDIDESGGDVLRELHAFDNRIARCSDFIRGHRALVTDDRVEERTLSDVGRTENHDATDCTRAIFSRTLIRDRLKSQTQRAQLRRERFWRDRRDIFHVAEVNANLDQCKTLHRRVGDRVRFKCECA